MVAPAPEAIGLGAAAVPHAWLSLFDTNPAMLEAGSRYLQVVGPVYGLFGLGLALYFASQGAGRLLWPLLANLTRLAIAAGGGWLALRWSGDVSYVFVALSAALAAFGLMNAWAVAAAPGSARSPGHGRAFSFVNEHKGTDGPISRRRGRHASQGSPLPTSTCGCWSGRALSLGQRAPPRAAHPDP